MPNHYVLWPEMILFIGALPKQIAKHSHPLIQLIIGAEKPFLKKSPDGSWQPFRSLLVAPNVAHECDAADQPIFTLHIDPESSWGEQVLRTHLSATEWISFTPGELTYFDFDRIRRLIGLQDFDHLHQICFDFFSVDPVPTAKRQKDERIEAVQSYIREHLHEPITSQILSEQVFLSESRLLHLFKTEMGLPIRNYILWVRLIKAVEIIMDGANLTRAAHEAGFFDSSHMSRTFVRMLGINPAEIFRNSKFVQVSVAVDV